MCNVLIESDDYMFRQGLAFLLVHMLESQNRKPNFSFDNLNERNVVTSDIIVLSFTRGEERICHKLLKSRSRNSIVIIFYNGHNNLFTDKLPLCLEGGVFINRKESISEILRKMYVLWCKRSSNTNNILNHLCLSCHRCMLSTQQVYFVSYYSHGAGTNEIARKMNITPKTVGAHKRQIMQKYNIHSDRDFVDLLRCIKNKNCAEENLSEYLFADHLA